MVIYQQNKTVNDKKIKRSMIKTKVNYFMNYLLMNCIYIYLPILTLLWSVGL